MKNCKKWLSVLMLLSVLALSTLGVSAQILPNDMGSGGDNGMHTPAEDVLPREGVLPDAVDDMMPHVDDGVIHDGQARDGRVADGDTVIDEATDGGISGTVWGVLIAVGIAALAVLFIFILMPRDKEKSSGGRGE